MSNFRNFF